VSSRKLNRVARPALVVAAAVAVFGGTTPAAGQAGQAEPILFNGDPAPPAGSDLFSFGVPSLKASINNAGEVAFDSDFEDATGADGVFRATSSVLPVDPITRIVRTGEPTPAGDGTFNGVASASPSMNNAGVVAFYATTSTGHGIFVGDAATRSEVMRLGQTEPGGDGTLYSLATGLAINASGQVAFSAGLLGTNGGTGDNQAIYRWNGPAQPLVPIVRKGDSAPGAGTFTGTAFQASQAFAEPVMNNAGQVAFSAAIVNPADGFDNGLFIGNGTEITQIARRGAAVPGGGGTLFNFSAPALNNAGQAAFAANYLSNSNWDGVFRGDGTTTTPIAKTGDPAPDGSGLLRDAFGSPVALNDAGQVAFVTSITPNPGGQIRAGLFRGDGTPGGLDMIAREATPSPDGDGVFSSVGSAGAFAMNEGGQLVFTAGLDIDPNNVTPTEEWGLFFHDDDLGVVKIVRQNDPFLGSTVTDFDFAGNSTASHLPDGRTGLNDPGQVAFTFALADGRVGLAVWSIPEPGAALATGAAACLAIARRRRRRCTLGA
jgi:hypothetical protein